MARSGLTGYQLASASIIPEFNFDLITVADIIADWQAITAGITFDIITYSQFQGETGCDAPHPLANLDQSNVLKINIASGTAGTATVSNDTICTAFSILKSCAGCFVYISTAAKADTGANGFRTFFEDGSLSHYLQGRAPVYDAYSVDTWEFCGIGPDDAGYYINKVGTPDLSALDHLHLTMHTDAPASDQSIYITSYFAGSKRKPIFCLEQDDLNNDSDIWIEDVEAVGLKTGFNAISLAVDLAGRPTTANMKTYLDNGHAVYLHGNSDLGTLGSSAALIAQFESEYDFWSVFYPTVLDDRMLTHGALPGGQTDTTVREWMRDNGYKTMRRTGALVMHALNAQPVYNSSQDYLHLPALTIDTLSSAAFIAHLDLMIQHGMDGVFYVHEYAATRAAKQAMLVHLKKRADEGLCEVMLRHNWYEKSIAQYGRRLGA